MTKLSSMDDVMSAGRLDRQMIEQCMAWCNDCKQNVTEWGQYNDVVALFIDHRLKVHHPVVEKVDA